MQDITSSVDFTAVALYAEELGLHVKGYSNQTYFLFGCGLEDLIPDMNSLDIKSQAMIAQQLRMLTMPDEMGERFKVIALVKKYNKKYKRPNTNEKKSNTNEKKTNTNETITYTHVAT